MKYDIGNEFVVRIGEEFRTSGVVGTGNEAVKSPDRLYRMEGFNSLVFDENGLDKLDQLTDDYINEHYGMFQDAAYQKGLDDAWEVMKKFELDFEDGGLHCEELHAIFGSEIIYNIFKNHSASEALEKIREYEEKQEAKEKQKAEEDFKVGDEIHYGYNTSNWIVLKIKNKTLKILNGNMATFNVKKDLCHKTGRHIPQIAEVLAQMKESEVRE